MKRVSNSDLEALRRSGTFDEKWYLEQYPDVKMLGMDRGSEEFRQSPIGMDAA